MKRTATLITSIAVLALSISSCKKKADAPEPTANVLIAHAVPDATSIDVSIDNKKVNTTAIGFGGTTGYVKVNAGDRMVKLNTVGSTTALSSASFSFAANKNYSVFAATESTAYKSLWLKII